MLVESWKSFFDIAAVVLLGLTFFAGAGVLLTGNIINRDQANKLRQLDIDIAKSTEAAASAEEHSKILENSNLKLRLELESSIEHQYPRHLTAEFSRQLVGRPKATADIWYSPEDAEAFGLASQIYDSLGLGTKEHPGVGWTVSRPQPIPDNAGFPQFANAPRAVKSSVGFGIGIISKRLSVEEHPGPWLGTPLQALEFALGAGTIPKSGITGIEMPSLPDNKFIIVVGPKL